jgi:threonine aldolase
MDAAALEAAIRPPSPHLPRASLVCLENTHNGAGGMITPLAEMRALRDVAARHGLPVHLDGARLWNASAASGTSLGDFAASADTVMVSFSKGLGAPVGAALAGSRALIEEGWFVRKRFGGGMRQSGILAAAALHALDAHLPRIADDHARAAEFAALVAGAGDARVVPPQTNIVMIDLPPHVDSATVVRAAADAGVLVTPWSRSRIRAVFHLDVDAAGARLAGETLARVLEAPVPLESGR